MKRADLRSRHRPRGVEHEGDFIGRVCGDRTGAEVECEMIDADQSQETVRHPQFGAERHISLVDVDDDRRGNRQPAFDALVINLPPFGDDSRRRILPITSCVASEARSRAAWVIVRCSSALE